MAQQSKVPTLFLVCTSDPAIVQARLAQRRGDVSDADWSVYELVAAEWHPLSPEIARVARPIDTTDEQHQALARALSALTEFGLWEEG